MCWTMCIDVCSCGSCWSHATVNFLNAMNAAPYMYKLKAGDAINMPNYSMQYLLDCVTMNMTKGCKGGTPMDALDWLTKHPIATAAEYPMRTDKIQGTCSPPASVASNPILSWGWQMLIPECKSKGKCDSQVVQEVEMLKILATNSEYWPAIYVDADHVC